MTAQFIGADISAARQPDGTWTLNRKLVYHSDVTGKTYTIPRGFNTDFASTPRLPVVYLLTGNTAHQAAVIHDYLYRTGFEDRATSDAIFREAMGVSGVPAWRKWLMWAGVRVGGAQAHIGTTDKASKVAAPGDSAKLVDD